MPAPPVSESAPAPPSKLSLPAPPVTVSSPAPPRTVSADFVSAAPLSVSVLPPVSALASTVRPVVLVASLSVMS